ncbi:MAG: hypothetical protein J5I93_26255 [Pirellulaceae bacterium]|nr:hypothetical protein [Pirellulaceae bacterium]
MAEDRNRKGNRKERQRRNRKSNSTGGQTTPGGPDARQDNDVHDTSPAPDTPNGTSEQVAGNRANGEQRHNGSDQPLDPHQEFCLNLQHFAVLVACVLRKTFQLPWHDVEDLVQDVLLKCHKRAGAGIRIWPSYVVNLAKRRAIDAYRKRKRRGLILPLENIQVTDPRSGRDSSAHRTIWSFRCDPDSPEAKLIKDIDGDPTVFKQNGEWNIEALRRILKLSRRKTQNLLGQVKTRMSGGF